MEITLLLGITSERAPGPPHASLECLDRRPVAMLGQRNSAYGRRILMQFGCWEKLHPARDRGHTYLAAPGAPSWGPCPAAHGGICAHRSHTACGSPCGATSVGLVVFPVAS